MNTQQNNDLVVRADHISSINTGEACMVLVCINTSLNPDDVKLRHVYNELRVEDSAGEFDHPHSTGFMVLSHVQHPDRAGFHVTHITVAKV